MIRWLYERHLLKNISKMPHSVCFMLTGGELADAPDKLPVVAGWCRELGIESVTFHISTHDMSLPDSCILIIRRLSGIGHLIFHGPDGCEEEGEGMDIVVAVGMSGREEIVHCVRGMAEDHIEPECVDEHLIESYLTFPYEPDLVIKTGGSQLTDFLIWQSVYSELFFSDVNWPLFRKTDLLRALRDYDSRKRRFGR